MLAVPKEKFLMLASLVLAVRKEKKLDTGKFGFDSLERKNQMLESLKLAVRKENT